MKLKQGFTLIETLLYILLISMFLLISSALLIQILQGMQKSDQLYEVNEGGTAAMTRILTTIRNAESITTPLQATTSSQLILATTATSTNPTMFFVQNEILKMKAGASATTTLTADEVRVLDMVFTNVGATGTPGSVRVEFTVNANQTDVGSGKNASKAFSGSATIRRRL